MMYKNIHFTSFARARSRDCPELLLHKLRVGLITDNVCRKKRRRRRRKKKKR